MTRYLNCSQNWLQCSLGVLWFTISYWIASGETICETPDEWADHVSLLQSHYHVVPHHKYKSSDRSNDTPSAQPDTVTSLQQHVPVKMLLESQEKAVVLLKSQTDAESAETQSSRRRASRVYIDRLRRVGLQHHTNAEIMYNKSVLIDSTHLFACVSKNNVIYKPLPNQYLESNTANSSIPIQLAAHLAAMVYVLCVDCDSLRFPAKVRNVQLVRAAALDACDHVPPDHMTQASVAHKAAVAHALLHHHSSIAILEEDSQINGANGVPDLAPLKVQINKMLATDKILRFAAWPLELVDSQGACNMERCKCHQDPMIPWCDLKQGCPYVTESSFYMMPESLYSRFIETGGYIDGNIFASFDSMLASPPITLQRESTHQETGEKWYASDQLNAWNKYARACTVRLPGIDRNFSKGT